MHLQMILENPTAWIDSSSGTAVNTKFPLAGDPVAGLVI